MSRSVRRVPMDWQHPMEWLMRWDRGEWRSRMRLVPRALQESYPDALSYWEGEGEQLSRREGFDWDFWSEYCLTGYQGRYDTELTIHQYAVGGLEDELVHVRDADHLQELLTADHEHLRPDPVNYMPEFPEGTATGWCMYETTSEGTPISPVMEGPAQLARWLADNGASAFGGEGATYEQWMRMIDRGWAPSAVATSTGVHSGVAFVAEAAS